MNDEQQKIFRQKLIEETEKHIKDRFTEIFRKGHVNLLPEDISFLQARRTYLTRAEVEEYQEELAMQTSSQQIDPMLDMTRKDLEQVALSVGVENPDNMKLFPNKDTLLTAIKAKQT